MEHLKHLYSQKFSSLPDEPEALRQRIEELVDYAVKNYYDIYYEGDLELYLIETIIARMADYKFANLYKNMKEKWEQEHKRGC